LKQREAAERVRKSLGRRVKVIDTAAMVEDVYVIITEDDNVMPGIGAAKTVRVTVFIGDKLDSQSIVRSKSEVPQAD
jgi:hypothetical protein